MAGIYVKDRTGGGATVVPNWFIDQFLPEASGEFVVAGAGLLTLGAATSGFAATSGDTAPSPRGAGVAINL